MLRRQVDTCHGSRISQAAPYSHTRQENGLQLNDVLAEREQTLYWLWKQTGIRWATIWQLGNGEVSRLSLDVLDRVCEALECQPGDLLVRVESKKRKSGK